MLTPRHRFRVPEGIAARVIDGEAIIINLTTGIYYSMDRVGGSIWAMLEDGHSLGQIAEAVIDRYEVSSEQAQDDLERVTAELVRENLIAVSDDQAAPQGDREVKQHQRLPYETPRLNAYRDLGELLALDPPRPGFADIVWKDPDEGPSGGPKP